MAYAYSSKRRPASKSARRSTGYGARRRSGGTSRARKSSAPRRSAAQPVIRIELVQGGPAPLAAGSPALPVQPSTVTVPAPKKAKL